MESRQHQITQPPVPLQLSPHLTAIFLLSGCAQKWPKSSLIVIIQDSLFIVLVAVVLRGISAALEWVIGTNRFFELVHEGLINASVLALACRAMKRLIDWVRRE